MRSSRFALESTSRAEHSRLRRLNFEPLEELLLLSAVGWQSDYEAWQQQTFSIGSLDAIDVSADQLVFSADTASAVGQTNQSLQLIGGNQVHQNYGYTGAGYTVAILDTGIDYTHPALASSYIGGWDFVDNDADPMDFHGHGTHVAGIIASADATWRGVAPDVNIISLRVLGAGGAGSFGDVEEALRWVANHQAQYNIVAVNMSLGSGNFSYNPWTFLEDELATIESQGVFVSAASGNSFYTYGSQHGLGYPAISTRTVSVGAVWDASYGSVSWASGGRDYATGADHITSFTQRSAGLDVLAPGGFIKSTYLGGGWKSLAGTSMAAPVVAGGAVLVHQALDAAGLGHLANQDFILQVMQDSGVTIVDGDDEQDNVTNSWMSFKRLDVAAAVASIGSQTPQTPGGEPTAVQSFVSAVYLELLGRGPDAAGLAYWTGQIQSGASRTSVVHAIWTSPEFQGTQVDSYYADFFQRAPRPDERAYWTSALINAASDTQVPKAFLASGEYVALHPGSGAFVNAVYQDVLGRAADVTGMGFWFSYLNTGGSRAVVAESLLTSAEYRLGAIDGYYQDYLGRGAGQSERLWWLSQVSSGAVPLRSIGELFLGSDEYFARTASSSGVAAGATALVAAETIDASPGDSRAPDVPTPGFSAALAIHSIERDTAAPAPAMFHSGVSDATHSPETIVADVGQDLGRSLNLIMQDSARLISTGSPRSADAVDWAMADWIDTVQAVDVDVAVEEFLDEPLQS